MRVCLGTFKKYWVASNILYLHPYLGKWSIFTNDYQCFSDGWFNHQLEYHGASWSSSWKFWELLATMMRYFREPGMSLFWNMANFLLFLWMTCLTISRTHTWNLKTGMCLYNDVYIGSTLYPETVANNRFIEIPYKLLYFEWSPPWHVGWRLSGEGCHWEYDGKNGEFENIDFRFPWLSDTSEMGFGHDVPFLNYSDRLPHPSDLCQPDRVTWG